VELNRPRNIPFGAAQSGRGKGPGGQPRGGGTVVLTTTRSLVEYLRSSAYPLGLCWLPYRTKLIAGLQLATVLTPSQAHGCNAMVTYVCAVGGRMSMCYSKTPFRCLTRSPTQTNHAVDGAGRRMLPPTPWSPVGAPARHRRRDEGGQARALHLFHS
jgi:hypothetical protein